MRLASLFLVAVGATIAGIYYSKNRATLQNSLGNKELNKEPEPYRYTEEHDDMDDRLDDSFPASDPPSWGPRDLLH